MSSSSDLVPQLVKEGWQVYLLLRAESPDHLIERHEELIEFWSGLPYSISPGEARARILPVRGDVTNERLGMSEGDYDEVRESISHLVHCAASVKLNMTEEDARQNCLLPTTRILEMLKEWRQAGRSVKLEFISTVGVSGHMSHPLVEEFIHAPRKFHNTYEMAKAEAELEIEKAMAEGLNITVHRPSMVIGDSRSGRVSHFQVFYHLCEFLTGRYTFHILPRLSGYQLDVVPNDYVARAIAWSMGDPSSVGRILHLCSGPERAVYLSDLKKVIVLAWKSRGKSLHSLTIPDSLFLKAVDWIIKRAPPEAAKKLSTLPYFLAYLNEKQRFENVNTVRTLSAQGITLPDANVYVGRCLVYYLNKKG